MSPDSPLDIAALRRNYALEKLEEQDAAHDPVEQFDRWFREALRSQLPEPNAMTLATADALGRPSARTVLLKGFDRQGFVFFTNYESRKGRELAENPSACLLFTWLELERQVRIEGRVEKVGESESLDYYRTRPRGSQLGAWASPQSRVIGSRGELETRMRELEARYASADAIPLPPFWGGYRLRPEAVEFWQGRESRLHDRLHYRLDAGVWRIERLAP